MKTQELEQTFPEFVITNKDGYKSVDYARLTPILVESIKELTEKINSQREELNEIKASLNSKNLESKQFESKALKSDR